MKWWIRDIIDLEYFLYKDGETPSGGKQKDLHERDRNIFLESVMPDIQEYKTPDRQFIIKIWLNRRREEEKTDNTFLPGEGVDSLYGSFRFIFLFIGLLIGGGLGGSFLTYTGDSPVNVFVYLSIFVFVQLLLLLLLFILSMYRLFKKSFLSTFPLYSMISRLMLRMLLSARNQVSRKLSAEQRMQTEFILGTILGKSRTYGFLFVLPVFILTQLFAIGFNLGLLGATLFKVATTDIAFGWQSTIQMSPEAVHSLVGKIAVPWSWALQGDAAYPSLAQIEGSRIILKEGIYHLSTPDLVSWWPFLCLAVLVYGLLPRVLLFIGAVTAQRRYLGSLDFRQGVYEQLLQRMATPLVTTRSSRVDDADGPEKEPESFFPVHGQPAAERGIAARNLLVMIPDDIYDSCSRDEIESVVNTGAVYTIREIIRINQDYASDRAVLDELRYMDRMEETAVLIIQEAWQPPIMEYIDFIKQVRMAMGDVPCIRIGLIGKPRTTTVFTPVKDEDLKIWAGKITAIGDPCIYSEGLVTNAV